MSDKSLQRSPTADAASRARDDASSRVLADFVARSDVDTLPPELYRLAKLYTMDTLGAAILGSTTPWAQTVARYARRFNAAGGLCSVIGEQWLTSPASAALVNGTLGHSFETDDVHDESLLHPGTVVVPAALAVAEERQASGVDYLTAVILGYELMVRAGLGVGSLAHMMGGFHSTGTNGVFGAAAAAAKLMPGPKQNDTVLHALGIAGSFAGGLMEFSQTGGMVKRLHAGRAAEGGVLAAYLAADGFTGPTTVLEGIFGYCASFSAEPEMDRLLADLGTRFAIQEITVKPYSCCSDLHAIIDCVYAIRARHAIEPAKVRRIVVGTYSKVIEQNALDGLSSVMAAQYSALFAAAAAVRHDLSDPLTFLDAPRASPELRDLCGKVELRLDAELERQYPRSLGAAVTVELQGGQSYSERVVGARGSPFNPLSTEQIEAKFRRTAGSVYDDASVELMLGSIDNLESKNALNTLTGVLRSKRKPVAGTLDSEAAPYV